MLLPNDAASEITRNTIHITSRKYQKLINKYTLRIYLPPFGISSSTIHITFIKFCGLAWLIFWIA